MTPNEFKAWRKRMGWTQKEAARQLEMSKMQLRRYETGVRHEDGRPQPVPHSIFLATQALENQPELKKCS